MDPPLPRTVCSTMARVNFKIMKITANPLKTMSAKKYRRKLKTQNVKPIIDSQVHMSKKHLRLIPMELKYNKAS